MWVNITFTFFVQKSVYEFSRSQLEDKSFALFHNKKVNRSLNKEFIAKILNEMEMGKKIEFKSSAKEDFFVLKSSIGDLADAIYKWAKRTARVNKVETIQFLSSNEEIKEEIFWGYPEEVILQACKVLESKGKIDLFDLGDEENTNLMGVKFK